MLIPSLDVPGDWKRDVTGSDYSTWTLAVGYAQEERCLLLDQSIDQIQCIVPVVRTFLA